MKDKRFRTDLFFRISTIPLVVPPLRERVEDIPLLAAHLVERLSGELGYGNVEIKPEAMRRLQSYSWPGNIREMRNVLERAVLLSGNRVIGEKNLHPQEVNRIVHRVAESASLVGEYSAHSLRSGFAVFL